jgi:hypothetical protein
VERRPNSVCPIPIFVQGVLRAMRLAKLRLGIHLLILTGSLGNPASVLADPPPDVRARIGTPRLRAVRPIDDARFSADGRRLVACAGTTRASALTADDSSPVREALFTFGRLAMERSFARSTPSWSCSTTPPFGAKKGSDSQSTPKRAVSLVAVLRTAKRVCRFGILRPVRPLPRP